MRRFLTALLGTLALVCAQPTTASAVPVADLCTPDAARGGVPDGFALDACVDATSLTVRNELDVPVLVRRDGDVGAPVLVHERGSAPASVLRLVTGGDELLMPGDVARWPLGAGAGNLSVADLEPAIAAIVDTLGASLPRLGATDGDQENVQAFAVVVREMAVTIEERMACVDGKNFLQAAACDVTAASTVSRSLIGQLPRRPAVELLPIALDPPIWADWGAPQRTELTAIAPSGRTLAQAAVPAPVVVPRPVPPPVPAAAAPAPAVVPTPTPTLPQLPDPAKGDSDLGGWLDDVLSRIGSHGNGNGNGNGNGEGHGPGTGHGRDGR